MFFSIVVPTYEMKGHGVKHLKKLFNTIAVQSFNDYEVIITDHSIADDIEDMVKKHTKLLGHKVQYFRNTNSRGNSSANMNNGIMQASGKFIKIMHMDDFFSGKDALALIYQRIVENPGKKWGASSFNHYHPKRLWKKIDDERSPSFLPFTRILIGNPSTIFFENDKMNISLFDESFIYVNDRQFNEYLFFKHGYPLILKEICVTIAMTDYRVTDLLSEQKKNSEIETLESIRIARFAKMTLSEIANYYGTDKGTIAPDDGNFHGPRLNFSTVYQQYFEEHRHTQINLLEIGIGSGTSLQLWQTYFTKARIYAFDIVENSQFDNSRVTTFLCDQGDAESLNTAANLANCSFDIIIDDGSHVTRHQILTFLVMFRKLKSGGQYWVEDLHTSDETVWKKGVNLYGYDMGENQGFLNAVDFFEKLQDNEYLVNHPMVASEDVEYLKQHIELTKMFDLGVTSWGKNKIALIKKR